MTVREASHAGSWYSDDPARLSSQLDQWLAQVPKHIQGIGSHSAGLPPIRPPQPGARVIIAPHAGYAYSGAAAAWAYKSLDLSKAKRIFLLGPSHHFYLSRCALSQCDAYDTPLAQLRLDKSTIAELHETGLFDKMSLSTDEDEHSLEMHLPYIYKVLSRDFPTASAFPTLIPILVGNTSPATESRFGALLAPYLADPSSIFIISSDFCHWGTRFRYTYFAPSLSSTSSHPAPRSLAAKESPKSTEPPIHESIRAIDVECMDACESGAHAAWLDVLRRTGNTVCGRHPVGIVLAALEVLRREWAEKGEVETEDGGGERGKFRFVRYERSGEVASVKESSVSYASAFAAL